MIDFAIVMSLRDGSSRDSPYLYGAADSTLRHLFHAGNCHFGKPGFAGREGRCERRTSMFGRVISYPEKRDVSVRGRPH